MLNSAMERVVRCFIGIVPCFILFSLIALGGVLAEENRSPTYVSIIAAGDFGLNGHRAAVRNYGFYRHGALTKWSDVGVQVSGVFDGDINFVNLETVVSDNSRLHPFSKTFNFLSHPVGVEKTLERMGINLLSTANNHSIDYGVIGITETLLHLQRWKLNGVVIAHAGIASDIEQAAAPALFEAKGVQFAFGAIGIDSGGRAGLSKPGLLSWGAEQDRNRLASALKSASAEFKLLSVHYGQELSVHPEADSRRFIVDIVKDSKIDLVLGHHAHVVRGIEIIDGKVIVYGLGNFLHPGMTDMNKFDPCRDYGLIVKLHYEVQTDKALKLRAIEALPIRDMNSSPRRLDPQASKRRVEILSGLSRSLGSNGVSFFPQDDGTGLYCASKVSGTDRIGTLCSNWPGVDLQQTERSIQCSSPGPQLAKESTKQPIKSKPTEPSDTPTWIQRVLGGD